MDKIILNSYIDHTILKPESTYDQIIQICGEAKKYQFASVCVNSAFASLVSKQLKGSRVKTGIVIGFPLGVCSTETKVSEVKDAIHNGAQEIDMVINVGALKSGDLDFVEKDIAAVIAATNKIVLVKVILETCLLTKDEIVTACKIAKKAGADFVKTSTGFNAAGATVEHIKLMRQTVGDKMGIKASGGIRTLQTVLDMIKAGANRIGCSSSVKIMLELEEKEM
jgi:deoxyribose-phosphate aldolase